MELTALSEREAYARIRQKSMDSQRPMVEIARAIILAYEMNGGIAAPLVKR
jgi:AmiR/NasT family two-component response regulator